jgi:hypothetical protein
VLRSIVALGLSVGLCSAAQAVQLLDDFPAIVQADERYVIYSHGLIAEGKDPTPIHPEYGVYDLPAIKHALFEDGGFNLIAHQRPAGAEIATFIATLETWVRKLLDGGVKPTRITLVGFSRGAALTAYRPPGFVTSVSILR